MNDTMVIEELTTDDKEPAKESFFRTEENKKDSAQKSIEDSIVGEVSDARNFVSNFLDYIRSRSFFTRCNEIAKKTGLSKKTVANSFFERILGTIGDVSGVTIDITKDVAITVIDLLSSVLKGAVSIIANVANALVRVITLNKTVSAV